MLARQGLVLEVDRTTPPIVFHHGEGFRFEKTAFREQSYLSQRANRTDRGRRRGYSKRSGQPPRRFPSLGGAAIARNETNHRLR